MNLPKFLIYSTSSLIICSTISKPSLAKDSSEPLPLLLSPPPIPAKSAAIVKSTTTAKEMTSSSFKNEAAEWADETREEAQGHLSKWANGMDDWFGEPDPNKPATASLRLVLDTRWVDDPIEGSSVTVEPRVRGRLRLPVLEEKLSLIIGDEDLDEETVLQGDTPSKLYSVQASDSDKIYSAKKTRDDNASIALHWSQWGNTLDNALGVETDFDIGVRSLDDVYVKVAVNKDLYTTDALNLYSHNFYRYGLDSEHYARGQLNLQYGKNKNRYISNLTTIRYRNQDDTERTDWQNDLRQVRNLHHNKQLSYGIMTSGDFKGNNNILNSYGPVVSYRQPIWREWLFLQTELNYYNDKAADKDHYPSALMRVEALF